MNNQLNPTGAYGYSISNKLESFNNIDTNIEQTPKKIYSSFPLGINSSHLVYNDKENSFIKANNDNQNDIPDHFQNNYQIPSHYPYNQNTHQTMDAYNYSYPNYGIYYHQQPYYGYDQYNGGQYPYYDHQSYQANLYNNNNYFFNNHNNKTPNTGYKLQQNIILQKSENKLTGQPNYNNIDEFGNKKEVTDFSLNNLVQQVNIPEFMPNFENADFNGTNNQQQQSAFTQPKQNQQNGSKANGKSSKSKSSMEQESEQQQLEESNKKSKITPSKRISKKKQRSAKQTPTSQLSSIQDNEDLFSNKTDVTLQLSLMNASNMFNKSLQIQRQSTSEQTSEHMIAEEDHNQKDDKETLKGVSTNKQMRRNSQNSSLKKTARSSNVSSSMISNTTAKIQDENYNMNILNINLPNQKMNNLFAISQKNENYTPIDAECEQEVDIEDEDGDDEEEEENDDDDNKRSTQKDGQQDYNKQMMSVDHEQSSNKSGSSQNNSDAKPCNCRNSKCLKRYCDCFAAGLYCQAECKCEECHNKPQYEDERQKAIQKKKKRIKDAFQPVIQNNTHIKGCHCKNSHCQKKYCVCHQNGVLCSSLCQCVECENKIEFMKKDQSNSQNQTQPPQSIILSQVPASPLQLQQIKNNNINIINNPNLILMNSNNNLFIQQHLQSPLNNNTKNNNNNNNNDSQNQDHTDVEFPSTIKKDSMGSKSKPFEEDFSTLKKPTKRKSFKSNEKQKALSFFNEISPADNKYIVNKS